MRAAVIGAGPAGFYACDQLLANGFEVDLLDALPTPFGLVRSGVAPDHPKIKSVTRRYEKTAAKSGFRFFGGVVLGEHVTAAELVERYHAVVYAIGTSEDNRLGIPGEDRPGSYAATRFVAWYNGHPDATDDHFALAAERAVVVGNGNVATDLARMLLLDPDELAATDVADHALEALRAAQVREVMLLGRRGPAQASFTNPELRELGEMTGVDVQVDPAEVDVEVPDDASPTARRNVEILRGYAERPTGHAGRRITMKFLRSPVEILGEGDHGPVTGVRVVRNRLEEGRAVPTGEEEQIGCGLVLRSIGYRDQPLEGVPFDVRRGLICNDGGRVCDEDGAPRPGEYAVGWIKRGPTGVIGTNKKDAADTVAKIVADAEAERLDAPAADADDCARWLASCAPDAVSWEGWQAIDEAERAAGEPHGRPRVKLVRLAELVEAGRPSSLASGADERRDLSSGDRVSVKPATP
jgi:ferredoxin/flavodoxin---NADP+ reductase